MIPPISEQNTFVVGKLPPNTVLVVKRDKQAEQSEAEHEQVKKLNERDAEVRAHESSHAQAAAGNVIGKSLDFQVGPDNKVYAIGGQTEVVVKADLADPAAAIAEAQDLRRAAHAVDTPSSQDLSAEQLASEIENKALASENKKTDNINSSQSDSFSTLA